LLTFRKYSKVANQLLRKLCIDRNVAVPNHRFFADVREEDEWVVYDNAMEDDMFFLGELAVIVVMTLLLNQNN
jgi:hypothetical protein